jgi:hypothetical protein
MRHFIDYLSTRAASAGLPVDTYIRSHQYEFVSDGKHPYIQLARKYFTTLFQSSHDISADSSVLPRWKQNILMTGTASSPSPYTYSINYSQHGFYAFFPDLHGGIPIFSYPFSDQDDNFFLLITDSTKGVVLAVLALNINTVYVLERSATQRSKFYHKLLTDILRDSSSASEYLENATNGVAAVTGVLNHWGHSMAQEYPLFVSKRLTAIKDIAAHIAGPRHYFDVQQLTKQYFEASSDMEIQRHIQRHRLLPLRLTTENFAFDLQCRVALLSGALTSAKRDLDELAALTADSYPAIALELRVNKRKLTNQVECYSRLCLDLASVYRRPCVLFMGWTSSTANKNCEYSNNFIKEENNVYESITASLPCNIQHFSFVGCTPSCKATLASFLIDYYVSSWGSGLSYYWEIGGKPGFVHGAPHNDRGSAINKPLISTPHFCNRLPPQCSMRADEVTFSSSGDYTIDPQTFSQRILKGIVERFPLVSNLRTAHS